MNVCDIFSRPKKFVAEEDREFYVFSWLGEEAMNIKHSWKLPPEESKKSDLEAS